jgi:hypothetical protein
MLTRKPALAAALAMTAILGFAVVTFGAQRGIFAWTQGTQSEAARQTVEIPQENPLAGWPQATPAVIEIQPVEVVTEYQVTDQVVPPAPVEQMAAAAPTVAPPPTPAPTVSAPAARAAGTTPAQAPTGGRPPDDTHERSDGGEHEDSGGGGD